MYKEIINIKSSSTLPSELLEGTESTRPVVVLQ